MVIREGAQVSIKTIGKEEDVEVNDVERKITKLQFRGKEEAQNEN